MIWAARDDDRFVRQIHTHCALLTRESGIIITNFLDDIAVGTSSVNAIGRLTEAHIRLMLISPGFFASLVSNPDMEDASKAVGARLEASALEGKQYRVIPTLVRYIDQATYKEHPLSKIQGLPRNGRPVESWRSQDEAWADTVSELRRVLIDLGRLSPPKRSW
jgi:hypothetical protein